MIRSSSTFDIKEVISAVRRSKVLIGTIVAISVLTFATASLVLPKRYKSNGVLGIQTDYFRYPLIEEFIPSPNDNSELPARRDALITKALSGEFLGQLGTEAGFVKAPEGTPEREVEIEVFRNRFEYYGLSLTTVQLVYTGTKPQATQATLSKAMTEIQKLFNEERRARIVHARDNIQAQIESMAIQQDTSSSVQALGKPELIRSEIERLEAQATVMRARLSARHPSVVSLQSRISTLKRNLEVSSGETRNKRARLPMLVGGSPQKAFGEVYESLVKKLAYLNVSLELEQDPRSSYVSVLHPAAYPMGASWPNKPLFVIWGLLVGLVVAGAALVTNEFFTLKTTQARRLAVANEIPLLGEMPRLRTANTEGSRKNTFGKDSERHL